MRRAPTIGQAAQRRPTLSNLRGILLGITLAGLASCQQETPPAQAAAAPAVTVAQPLALSITDWDEYTGRVEAVDSVEVRARVSGYLQSAHFTEGAIVQAGDLLFVIDPRPYQAALDEAKAGLARAEVQLQLARNDLKRAQNLYQSRAVSEEELDARTQGQKEIGTALEAARAAAAAAALNLEFTEVRAPVSGRVSRKHVTEGNLIEGGSAASTLLTTLVSLDPVYVYFTADERAYLNFARRNAKGAAEGESLPMRLKLADEKEFKREGQLDFVDNRIDAGTNTMLGRAVFANPDRVLIPGLFVRLELKGRGPYAALLVPDEAVLTDQAQKFVYVVGADQSVERRPVVPGRLHAGLRVIEQGVQASDRVVIRGVQRASAGSKVSPIVETLKVPAAAESPERSTP